MSLHPSAVANRYGSKSAAFGELHVQRMEIRQYWGIPMLSYHSSPSSANRGATPQELCSILLVEADSELRFSRRLVLGSLGNPVLAVGSYREVCELPSDSNCCLIAVDLRPSEHEARRVAFHCRRTWPRAKVLLLGQPSEEFDDPLYDDAVGSIWNPAGVMETVRQLLCAGKGESDFMLLPEGETAQ